MIILLCHYWDSGEKTSMDGNHLQHKSYNTMYVVFNVSLKNQTKYFAGKCMKIISYFQDIECYLRLIGKSWKLSLFLPRVLSSLRLIEKKWILLQSSQGWLQRIYKKVGCNHHVRILKSPKTLEATSALTFNINWGFESVIDSFGSSGKFSSQKKLVLFKSNLFAQIQEHPIL